MKRRTTSKPLRQAPAILRRRSARKHDDVAHRGARAQRGEPVIDLLQLELAGNEMVEMELALQIEFDQARHIDPEAVGAHEGSLDFAFAEEIGAVQLDL